MKYETKIQKVSLNVNLLKKNFDLGSIIYVNINFIAFPKNNSGRDVMIDAPAFIDDAQLKELGLKIK